MIDELWMSLRFALFLTNKIDRSTQKLTTGRIPYFDIRQSTFDICHAGVSFSIRPAVFLAGGWAEPETYLLLCPPQLKIESLRITIMSLIFALLAISPH